MGRLGRNSMLRVGLLLCSDKLELSDLGPGATEIGPILLSSRLVSGEFLSQAAS